jgi:succinate-semialdehyde dehydrogenase / glutarate-semialdehyde dehydrogenase
MAYPDTRLFIDGEWRDARDGRSLPVLNPATGQEIGRVAHAGIADLDEALAAAARGFVTWRNVPAAERGKLMRRAAQLLRERAAEIAGALTQEQGKPLLESKQEVLGGADFIDWAAEEGTRVYGRLVPPRNLAARQMVLKDPVGPVAAFTPWNYPINQTVRKISAALATGCSIITKAAEETPAAPAALVQAFIDAGIPPGVLGLVYGDPAEISNHLIAHPVIRKVTFTGSTVVGKQLAALAGRHMKRATMELGGHAPVIIAADADIALAVKTVGAVKFRNAGQICIAPTRFLVHQSVAADFTAAITDYAQSLAVKDGLLDGAQMGPLANERRVKAMEDFTADAIHRGARVVTGGCSYGGPGNFWSPTVMTDVPLDARLSNEEPFGPVALVRSFGELEEAITEANRLPHGLSGYAFTRSLKTTHELATRMEVGMLWINQAATPWPELPFGGVKDSGYGSEGGPEALDAYLNTRTVSITAV